MAEHPRLEELRRRVLADPASIAFAALAEEYRRSGSYEEAIETCRTGLQRHPSYLSARVTLGRALIETAQYDEARAELELVLKTAPENLAAIRGLAEIHERLGDHADHALVAEAAHQSPPIPSAAEPSIPVPAVPESPIADWLLPPKPVAAPPSAPAVSPAAAPSPLVGAVATPASSPVAVAPTPIALSAASAAPPVAESIPVAPPARAPIPIAAAASAPAAAAAGTTAPLIARTPIAVATPAPSPDAADAVPVRPTASAAGPDPVVARLEDFLAAIQTARTSARDAR